MTNSPVHDNQHFKTAVYINACNVFWKPLSVKHIINACVVCPNVNWFKCLCGTGY